MPMMLNVPDTLIELTPDNIDDVNLEDYLLASLEVGIRAMNQANINADTAVVSDTFRRISDSLAGRLIGDDSELSKSVNNLFSQSDSPFRRAMDPLEPSSPVARFLKMQSESQEEHTEAVTELVESLQGTLRDEFVSIREDLNIASAVAEEAAAGTKKGLVFEDEVLSNLREWQKFPDSFDPVGDEAVGKTRRKVGDVLATISDKASIVIEVKAGSNYTDTGDKSLDKQMDESMAYNGSSGSISVTTMEAMEKKNWQKSIFLDRGKNRIIVAVDREAGDFTILRLAYMLLRERIISKSVTDPSAKSGISPDRIKQVVSDIESDMSSVKKIRQTISDIEGRIEDMRSEITNFSGKIRKRQEDLQDLIE
tara:strand:- start:92 stop:1192 length:1101 start_codon:yes stop_codon:yes gene_type:complete